MYNKRLNNLKTKNTALNTAVDSISSEIATALTARYRRYLTLKLNALEDNKLALKLEVINLLKLIKGVN